MSMVIMEIMAMVMMMSKVMKKKLAIKDHYLQFLRLYMKKEVTQIK